MPDSWPDIKFEEALRVIKARIRKELKLNNLIGKYQRFSISIGMNGIIVDVWKGKEIVKNRTCLFFHPNGKFKY